MEIVFVDHYDSFSYNVKDWVVENLRDPFQVEHIFCDDRQKLLQIAQNPKPIILSPGPGHPRDYPATLDLAKSCLGTVPILGICLGHQVLGVIGGAQIRRSKAPFHGTVRDILLKRNLFSLPPHRILKMGVYHSLVIDNQSLGLDWDVIAFDELGEIAAIELQKKETKKHDLSTTWWPAVGLQFHPESYLSIQSENIIKGWLERDVYPWVLTQHIVG